MPRTVVITGCSTGFGHVTALHLARGGWRVFATVRQEAHMARLSDEAVSHGLEDRLIPLLCDITQQPSIDRLHQEVAKHTPVLDALVNNAGTGYPAPLELLPVSDLRAQLEVNLVGHLAVTQALLPLLKAARGTIVNVSSISGRVAYPINGAYSISKFGLEAMSDVLRLELAHFGVKVVVIEPGSSPTAIWETSLQRGRGLVDGASAYAPLAAAFEQLAAREAAGGFRPGLFADTVQRIIESPRPAARYPVPGSIAVLIALRRLLPDWLWDLGLRRFLRW
jgi:NAD(P)-dependent dehydrogenase (short-subunit alcohol dehydrogenase family)